MFRQSRAVGRQPRSSPSGQSAEHGRSRARRSSVCVRASGPAVRALGNRPPPSRAPRYGPGHRRIRALRTGDGAVEPPNGLPIPRAPGGLARQGEQAHGAVPLGRSRPPPLCGCVSPVETAAARLSTAETAARFSTAETAARLGTGETGARLSTAATGTRLGTAAARARRRGGPPRRVDRPFSVQPCVRPSAAGSPSARDPAPWPAPRTPRRPRCRPSCSSRCS